MNLEENTSPVVTDADRDAATAPVMASRWAIHRHTYDWMLTFAHHKRASWALFVFSFIESSVFPIPPDVLLAPMCLGRRERSLWFGTVCTVASVLGALAGYAIGWGLTDLITYIPGISADGIAMMQDRFETQGHWYVFIAALTPIPFKLLTIASGVAHMHLGIFVAACIIGRSARFYAVAALFWWVGPRAVPLIDRYFNWVCILATALLVGGYALVRTLG